MSIARIVIASSNPGKLREFSRILPPGIEFIAQTELDIPEAAETGASFVENAIIKARNACVHSGKPALADDSGLEVDYLDGRPGVRSARYAGDQASSADNIALLLRELDGVPEPDRRARFYCVIVFMRRPDDATPVICEGAWDGRISKQRAGEHGFGYDPIFYDPARQCCAAEMSAAVKNKISHRARAIARLSGVFHSIGEAHN